MEALTKLMITIHLVNITTCKGTKQSEEEELHLRRRPERLLQFFFLPEFV